MPCQVPSFSLPPATGTCSDTPLSMDLIWDGMSSGPSTSCTQPASAGATRLSAVTRSVCTSGSAFSWMTSEAEVCRRKSSATPSRASIFSRKRATSRVISKKPSPDVCTASAPRSIVSTRVLRMAYNSLKAAPSALVQHLLLRPVYGIDEAIPHPADIGHGAVDVGIIGQADRDVVVVAGRGFRRRAGRQRQAVRQHGLLERGVLAAQPRDLALECGAILRRRLTGPADGALAAQRHFAGLRIEPDKTVGHFVERIAPAIGIGRRVVGKNRRAQADGGDDEGNSLAEHDHLLTGSGFRQSSGERRVCVVNMGGQWVRLKACAVTRFVASQRTIRPLPRAGKPPVSVMNSIGYDKFCVS